MREQHPIDDLFKRELGGITAEPPAHLRAAVIAASQSRYRRALWRTRSRMTIALLLLLLVPTSYWLLKGGSSARSTSLTTVDPSGGSDVLAPIAHAMNGTSRTAVVDEPARAALAVDLPTQLGAGVKLGARAVVGTDPPAPVIAVNNAALVDPVADTQEGLVTTTQLQQADATVDNAGLVPAATVRQAGLQSEDAYHMIGNRVVPVLAGISGVPVGATIADTYVLPHGEWWLAPYVSAYAAQHAWEGTSTRLVDALNNAESPAPSAALGLMVGRRWRSGFGAGLGVEVEHAEQAYRHIERNTIQEHTVIANMVTLNTTVIALTYDTLSNDVVREYDAQGLDQRTTVRIPLEAFWQVGRGRWVLGARVGAMAEINRVRSGSSLVQDEEDGHIYSTALSNEAIGARYPTCLTGLIGADLGYALHERWTLLATPHYARGFVPGGHGALQATPERLGLRIQLCHYL